MKKIIMAALISALVMTGCSDKPENGIPGQKQMDNDLTSMKQTLTDYAAEENNQAKAWIQVPDTNIDDPIFQADDNLYWLRRDENGSYSVWGVYFADYECSLGDELSRNTVIYGHSSLNDETEGKKFTELKKLNLQDFAKDHRYFLFATGSEEYVATIFSVGYWADSAQYLYADPSDAAFEELLKDAADHSIYNYGVDVGSEDHIITLSTCTGNDQERFVVMARLGSEYTGQLGSLEINPTPKGA